MENQTQGTQKEREGLPLLVGKRNCGRYDGTSKEAESEDMCRSLVSNRSLSFRERPAFADHLGKNRQYWRDIMLGVNDGLISTFLLVTGVCGGSMSTSNIFLTAMSGSIAGAISMAAGEYIATKAQDEVLQGEIELEERHIRHHRDDELRELDELLSTIGIPREARHESGDTESLREQLIAFYSQDEKALLRIMKALEFGVLEAERRYPYWAAGTSFALFFLGSLPSVIPFAIVEDPHIGLVAAGSGTLSGLILVGVAKTWATRGRCLDAAIENLVIAGIGGLVAYTIGHVVDGFVERQE